MAKQKKRVWNSLRYYDNETMLEEGAFKAMLEDGWICTHMAWSQTNVEDSDKYPENLIRELEKKDPYHDWPETISEEHLKGLTFVLALLDDKTQDILSLRYQKGLTLEAIGSIYELTRERVRQIIQMALSDIVEDYEKSKIISLGLDSYINRETVRRYNLEETYCSSCGREIAKESAKKSMKPRNNIGRDLKEYLWLIKLILLFIALIMHRNNCAAVCKQCSFENFPGMNHCRR